jgi:hypothetical protein
LHLNIRLNFIFFGQVIECRLYYRLLEDTHQARSQAKSSGGANEIVGGHYKKININAIFNLLILL